MLDTDYDLEFSSSIPQANPKEIVSLAGDIFECVDHPAYEDRPGKHRIREARYKLREYINRHSDKPHAFWEVFQAAYQGGMRIDGLKLDGWSQQLYYGGKLTSPEKLMSDLEDILEVSSKMHWDAYLRKLGVYIDQWRKFNPVERYLSEVYRYEAKLGEAVRPILLPEWDSLASKLLGADDELSQQMLTKWLIGAVARAVEPGCQMDNMLVLVGEQGVGKTTFLRTLFGEYFVTIHSHQKDEEQKRILCSAWGLEYGELESVTRKRDVEDLKSFLSETNDTYRELYAKTPQKHPRHCVFAGTANSADILRDETGNRRFWIVDVGSFEIPLDWLKQHRDLIWATAYHHYKDGASWVLDKELAKQSEERNKDYTPESEFVEPLRVVLAGLEARFGDSVAVMSFELMLAALDIPKERQSIYSKKLAPAMKTLGWEKKSVGKARSKAWCKVGSNPTEILPFSVIEEAKTQSMTRRS